MPDRLLSNISPFVVGCIRLLLLLLLASLYLIIVYKRVIIVTLAQTLNRSMLGSQNAKLEVALCISVSASISQSEGGHFLFKLNDHISWQGALLLTAVIPVQCLRQSCSAQHISP